MVCIICNNINTSVLHPLYNYCDSCFHIKKQEYSNIEIGYHCRFYKHIQSNEIVRLLEINDNNTFSNFIRHFTPQNYSCYLEGININLNNNYKYDVVYINDVFSFIDNPHDMIKTIKNITDIAGRIFIKTHLPNFIFNLDSIEKSNHLNTISIFNTNSMKQLCNLNYMYLNNAVYQPRIGKTCLYEISLQPFNTNYINVYDIIYDELSRDMYSVSTYSNFKDLHFF